jgi:predicted amidohydrolase
MRAPAGCWSRRRSGWRRRVIRRATWTRRGTGSARPRAGADLVVLPAAYEWEARSYWDRYYPGAALANGQWWVLVNQCGTTASGTLLGASKIISPAGAVVAEARRAAPPATPQPELLLCRLEDSDEIKEARAFAQLMREQRRGDLYPVTPPAVP